MNVHLSKADKVKLLNSEHIYNIMQKILLREDKIKQKQEHFWILGLSSDYQLLFIESIPWSAVNEILVEPVDVYSVALQKGASKIVLCHNRPNGELKTSEADHDITDRLIQVGVLMNLPVIDHLLISDTNYFSFEDVGLMGILRKSFKYVPNYALPQRIDTQMYKLMKKQIEEVRLKAKLRILQTASQLKKRGMSMEEIAACTNLTIEELQDLE
jgi:DNA repair protein RadC